MESDSKFFELVNQGPNIQREYEDAYSKSVASEGIAKPTSKSNMKSNKILSKLIAIGMIVVMAISAWAGISVSNVIEDLKNSSAVSEYFQEIGVKDLLRDSTWGQLDGNGNYVYGYNQGTLATWVEEQPNQDVALFGLHKEIPQNKSLNMNEIISRVEFSDGAHYSSQAEYFTARGFVDKDGNPSTKVYEDVMTDRVMADITIKETSSNHGVK